MAIIRRPKAVSGFMYEASVISQVTSEIETAFANCMGKGVATFRLGNVWFDLQTERLSVLFGRSKSRIEMLASNLVFQRVFRQGHDCGVFCQSPKDFVKGQLALLSEVGIKKLYSGEIHDDDWTYIFHALDVITDAPLSLGQMPATLELLKDLIRHYASECKAENRKVENCFAVVFDLNGGLERALYELGILAADIGMPIVVVHHAGEDAESEYIAFSKYADAVIALCARADEVDYVDNLSIQIKRYPSRDKERLIFDPELYTVLPAAAK